MSAPEFDVQPGHVEAFDVQTGHVGELGPGADFSGARSDIATTLTDPRTYTKALPVVGAVVGSAFGAPAGPVGVAAGGGMGAAAGRGAQHIIDTALGYEKPIENAGELGEKLVDMGKEGAITAAASGALSGALSVAGRLAGPVAAKLKDFAISQGRRVLTGGAQSLSTKAPLAAEAVEEAFKQGAIKPLGTTEGAAETLSAARERVGELYGRIVAALEKEGITGPDAQVLAQKYTAEAVAANADTMNPAVRRVYESAAEEIGSKPVGVTGKLGLTQAENLKRSLQGQAKSAYSKLEPTEVGDAYKSSAAMMRQAVEDEIAQQAATAPAGTKAIADQFIPVKDELGRIIQASDVAEKGAAQAARRRVVSPSDYIAGAAGVANAGPAGAVLGAANHLARTRGTATAAWAANSLSDKIATLAMKSPAKLGRYGAILGAALQRGGQQEFDAHMYALGQTDQGFQELTKKLAEERDDGP